MIKYDKDYILKLLKQNKGGVSRVKHILTVFESDLDDYKLDFVYKQLPFESDSNILTAILLASDIDPLNFIEYAIPKQCFCGLPVESVDIPNGIRTISSGAFSDCYELRRVVLPTSIEYIDITAFDYCELLTSLKYEGTTSDFYRNVHFCRSLSSRVNTINCKDGQILL